MSDIYQEYVERLGRGDEPTRDDLDAVCEQFRKDLRQVMQRRGLWSLPPAVLGTAGASWTLSLLDDLVADAYVFNFVDRLRHLQDSLRPDTGLRPLVWHNLENFLSERQRANDPVGYRIFGCLEAALLDAVDRGLLFLTGKKSGKRKIHNDQILSFHPEKRGLASPEDLASEIDGWDERIVTSLVTAETNTLVKARHGLASQILALKDAGVRAFRFKDLIDPVKRRAWRWSQAQLFEGDDTVKERDDDGIVRVVHVVRPDTEPDSARRHFLLDECVAGAIEGVTDRRTRDQLWQVWQKAKSCAAAGLPRPAYSKLSRELGIPRERRLPKLYQQLGEIVEKCLQCTGRVAAEPPADATSRGR